MLVGPDCNETIDSAGFNILWDDTDCIFNDTTRDQVGTAGSPIDPLLGTLADNGGPTMTHAPLEASPAIDAGNCIDIDGDPVLKDKGGVFRPQGPSCDIGSFELVVVPPVLCRGLEATIVGAEEDDDIFGTPSDDVIAGLGGDDAIFGRRG